MTSQEKDRFIAEKLGLQRHNYLKADSDSIYCTCGKGFNSAEALVIHQDKNNIKNFTSEAGRIALLKLISPEDINLTKLELIDCLKDDDGFFRDVVFRWMGGVE